MARCKASVAGAPSLSGSLGPRWDHTLCALVNDPRVGACHARPPVGHILPATHGNAVTAIFWGSSGRRFKSLPRLPRSPCRARRGWAAPGGSNSATPGADVQLLGQPADHGRGIRLPIQPHRALKQLDGILAIRCQQNFLPRFTRSNLVRKSPEKQGNHTPRTSCGVLGTPTTIVSTRLTVFLACQGGEARHGCILRGARVRDHPAKRALKLRAVLAQAPPVLTSPNQGVIRACSGLAHCKTEGPTSRTVRRGRRRRRSGRPPFDI